MTIPELLAEITATWQDDQAHALDAATHLVGALKDQMRVTKVKARNYLNVPDGELRRDVEAPWNALSDELDVCYYQFWRKGLSRPFHGHDLQATPAECQALFNSLSDAIDTARTVALHDASDALPADDPRKIPDRRRLDADGQDRGALARQKLATLASRGVTVVPPTRQPRAPRLR